MALAIFLPFIYSKLLFSLVQSNICNIQEEEKKLSNYLCSNCIMGDWDYYCALCGSTFSNIHISRKPRTARFLRARRLSEATRPIKELEEKGEPIPGELQKTVQENQKREDDADSLDSYDEENSYDPEIITKEEAAWIEELQCLGFNANSTTLNKAFLSNIGESAGLGGLEVEGDDPNFPEDNFMSAYWGFDGTQYAIPFHHRCIDVFHFLVAHKTGRKKLAESSDGYWMPQSRSFDKDSLYSILDAHSAEYVSSLDLKYGDPEPPLEQYWMASPGEEIFIAHPTRDDESVQGMILDAWHGTETSPSDHQPKSFSEGTKDPFARLPFELLLNVVSEFDIPSLVNLMSSSAHVYRSLDNNYSFWLQFVKKSMPWFFELHRFLESLAPSIQNGRGVSDDADALGDKSLFRLFKLADKATTPRKHMRGPFMGIANRRRIWGVCKQIVDPYISQAEDAAAQTDDEGEEAQIRNTAVCMYMPVVNNPRPHYYHPEKSFWVKSWVDTFNGCTLKVFWNSEKQLAGLGIVADGDESSELRLLGVDDSQHGNSLTSMRIQSGDWINGFIIYYPNPSLICDERGEFQTSIVGITVLLRSGTNMSFGNIETQNAKRVLAAGKNMVIVGLAGHIGDADSSVGEPSKIHRLGLMQCTPGESSETAAQIPAVELLPWADDCTTLFGEDMLRLIHPHDTSPEFARTASPSGVPIWDIPGLRLQGGNNSGPQ